MPFPHVSVVFLYTDLKDRYEWSRHAQDARFSVVARHHLKMHRRKNLVCMPGHAGKWLECK